MEYLIYCVFCAMCLGGALGVIMIRGFVNSAMSMLVSMLGVAGLMLLMRAYFLAFLMVTVYAGAVLVLFVFVVMLVGDKRDGVSAPKKIALLAVWGAAAAAIAFFEPQLAASVKVPAAEASQSVLAVSKNYGYSLFTTFILPFEIAGMLLLAALVGIIAVAKQKSKRKPRIDLA